MALSSDEHGEILEIPQASEVYERLPQPKPTEKLKFLADDKVRKWRARIDVARKIRDQKLKNVKKYIDFYEGRQWHNEEDIAVLSDKTTINLIFANIKKELPYLYFQNPTPIVNATRGEFELPAYAMQELLKYYTKFNLGSKLKKHVRLAILDAKFAFGCLKTTYTPRFSVNPNKDQPALAGYDYFGYPIFAQDEEGNIITEPDEILISELYYIERICPKEILIDPWCRNFTERAKWIGQEIVKPLGYLKENDLYENTEYLEKNIELSEIFQKGNKTTEEIQASRELVGDDIENVRFVEIYDLENNELLCLPDNTDFFIRQENIFMNPFSFLKFNESPDNFYPVADIQIEKPLQQEVNVGQSMLITHARRAARKYAYTDETFRGIDNEEGMEALKDPDDMTLVKIADMDEIPKPIENATQDPSVFQYIYQSRINYNEVVGSTEMQRGVVERRKTKGEATFQESHGAVRRGDKQSLVADFIVDTYENLATLMQETLNINQAIKIIGKSGIFWTEVSRNDIQGKFFYNIEVSEMRPQIPEVDRMELAEFIFALSNFLNSVLSNPVGPYVFNLQGLVKEFAKSYPSIKAENILNMKVTPEQIAELVLTQSQKGQNANI